MLNETDDIEVIGEAQNGFEVQELVPKLRPRILLLDLKMPGRVLPNSKDGRVRITRIQKQWC
jgi:DNA-binding NarL/FixJ family response regulator